MKTLISAARGTFEDDAPFIRALLVSGHHKLGRFSDIYTVETFFFELPVRFPVQIPYEKGSTLKGKNLLPQGANSFLLG